MTNNNFVSEEGFFKTTLNLQSFLLIGIFLILLFAAFHIAHEFFIPLIIALLFNFLLTPSVRLLTRLYIPRAVGSAIVILLLLLIIAALFYGLIQPATTWLSKGPEALTKVEDKITSVAKSFYTPFQHLAKLNAEITSVPQKSITTPSPSIMPNQAIVIGTVAFTWSFLLEFAATLILLYFLLCYDNYFLRIIVNWTSSLEGKKDVVLISHEIEHQIFRFLFARTALNLGLAIVLSILFYFFDMPNPFLWGIMTGVLEYIPYLGAFVSLIVILVVALFSFASIGYAFLLTSIVFLILIIEGNIITAIVFGRTLTLNPIIVFIGLMFFSWLWGIAGTFVAVPLMVSLKIIADML